MNSDLIEKIFESKKVPPWQPVEASRIHRQLYFRDSLTLIVVKLNLTTRIISSLNVSAGLLGFFFVKMWTKFLGKSGLLKQPFTRQQNTIIQTCVVASSGIAFSGKFRSVSFSHS
ncbi:putative oligopeptide transporter, OPT superfamily [Helianthus debilis subsp. tardiflorus]